jgi:hypothetical protein
MAEQKQPTKLSEYKKQLTQPINNQTPKTLSEYKQSLIQGPKTEEPGFIENLWRFGGGAVRDVLQSTKEASQFTLETLGKFDPTKATYAKILETTPDIPEVPEPTTTVEIAGAEIPVGSIARDIAGFAIPYAPLTKGAQAISAIPKGASLFQKGLRATAVGSAAEQFAFSPTEERLSNLIQSYPSLQNPITEYLQADKDDTQAEGRLKMAIEGSVLGVAFETVFQGLRAIKNVRKKDVPQETLEASETAVQKSEEANKEIEQVIPTTPKEQPGLTVEQIQQQRKEVTKEPFVYNKETDTYTTKLKKQDFEITRDPSGTFRIFKAEPLTPQQIDQRLLDDVTGELKVQDLVKERQMLPYEQSFTDLAQAKRFVIEESRPTKLPSNLKELPKPKVRTARSYLYKSIDPAFARASELKSALGVDKIPLSYIAPKTRLQNGKRVPQRGYRDFDDIQSAMEQDQFYIRDFKKQAEDLTDDIMNDIAKDAVHPDDKRILFDVEAENIERKNKIELLESFGVRPEKTTKEEVDLLVDAAQKKAESLDELASLAKAENNLRTLREKDILEGNVGLPSLKNYKDLEVSAPPLTDKDIADIIPRLRTEYEEYIRDVDIEPKFIDAPIEPIKKDQPPEIKSKYIVNVNMNRLDATIPEKIKLAEIAEQYEEPLEIARNVTKFGSKGENLKALAEETGLNLEDLLKSEVGTLNTVNAFKLRLIFAEALKELVDLSKAIKDPMKRTPELEYEYEIAQTRFVALLERYVGEVGEKGRSLGQMNIPIGTDDMRKAKIITEYYKRNKSNPDINEAIADAVTKLDDPKQVAEFMGKVWKPSGLDMVQEFWMNSILSSPTTHLVNILGNAGNIFMSVGEQATAASYGLLKGAKEADRMTFKEVNARLIGNILGLADGLKIGTKALLDENFISDPYLKVELARKKAIPGFVGKVIRIPTRALGAEDAFFKAINYRQSLLGLATRQAIKEGKKGISAVRARVREILKNPEIEFPDLHMESVDYSRLQTYTNPLGPLGQAAIAQLNKPWWKLGRFFTPFIQTPVNIIKYAFERTPLGVMSKRYKDAIEAGGAEADIAKAKIIFSAGIMTTLGMYAAQGFITGRGPEDPKERAVLRETGWQEYSIKVGDQYISYERLEPFGILLGLTADFVNVGNMVNDNILVSETDQQELEDKDLLEEYTKIGSYLIASFADNITNKTYLRGVSDLIKVIDDPERYGSTYINNFLSSPIPNVYGYIRRYDDPFVRDARNVLDSLINKTPGMSSQLPARRNIFGEPIRYTPGAAPQALGRTGEVFSPFRKTQINDDIVFNEFLNLEFYPSMPKRSIKDIDLTPEQYEFMMGQHKLLGTKEEILNEITDPGWNQLKDYEKKEILSDIMKSKNEEARFYTELQYPEIRMKIEQKEERKLR